MTRAEALLVYSYLCQVEADAHASGSDSEPCLTSHLRYQAELAYLDAELLGADDDTWNDVLDWFAGRIKL